MGFILGLILLSLPAVCFSCWAAPVVFGPECTTGSGLIGATSNVKVHYSISVGGNVPTLVCCEGYGCGNQFASSCGSWGWYGIGCSNSGSLSGSLHWGNTIGQPKVKCKGVPTGALYTVS